jgi:hypothetical protein
MQRNNAAIAKLPIRLNYLSAEIFRSQKAIFQEAEDVICLKLSGILEEQAIEYLNKAEKHGNGAQWAQQSIMAFHDFHK